MWPGDEAKFLPTKSHLKIRKNYRYFVKWGWAPTQDVWAGILTTATSDHGFSLIVKFAAKTNTYICICTKIHCIFTITTNMQLLYYNLPLKQPTIHRLVSAQSWLYHPSLLLLLPWRTRGSAPIAAMWGGSSVHTLSTGRYPSPSPAHLTQALLHAKGSPVQDRAVLVTL